MTALEFMDKIERLCHKHGFEISAWLNGNEKPVIFINSVDSDNEVCIDFVIGDKRGKE